MQNLNLLKPGIERHDLEELQGVVGLKALRADINFEEDTKMASTVEISKTTSQELIGK